MPICRVEDSILGTDQEYKFKLTSAIGLEHWFELLRDFKVLRVRTNRFYGMSNVHVN